MVSLSTALVEQKIVDAIEEVKTMLNLDAKIDKDSSPGGLGIASQILLTNIGRIAKALGVIVPNSCYIFFDKKNNAQLTIKEAAQKLIKEAKYGTK